jgi:CRP-like cAMP-binding protein
MGSQQRPAANSIIERLPRGERASIAAVLEDVEVGPGEVLCSAGRRISHVYFPRRGVVLLFADSTSAPLVGVDLVGTDGMIGLDAVAGRTTARFRAASQGRGSGGRIDAAAFGRVLRVCPQLRIALLAHAESMTAQLSQNIACAAFHPSRARLARWMLDVTRGLGAPRFFSTQADMAVSLGVRRAAVSEAAAELQRSGLIRYLRGEVTILDRRRLRAVACTCSMAAA